jgi:hypothetical protein
MLSLRNNDERPRAACNDNGYVAAAPYRKSPTFLNLLADAHNGRGLTLTYIADGVLIISKGTGVSSRCQFRCHEPAERNAGVRQSA